MLKLPFKPQETGRKIWDSIKAYKLGDEPFNTYIYLTVSWICALGAYVLTRQQLLFNGLMVVYLLLYLFFYIRYDGSGVRKGKLTKYSCWTCFLTMVVGIQLATF